MGLGKGPEGGKSYKAGDQEPLVCLSTSGGLAGSGCWGSEWTEAPLELEPGISAAGADQLEVSPLFWGRKLRLSLSGCLLALGNFWLRGESLPSGLSRFSIPATELGAEAPRGAQGQLEQDLLLLAPRSEQKSPTKAASPVIPDWGKEKWSF